MTECLKQCLMLQQMRESTLYRSLNVPIASETQKNQSSDWPRRHCALWSYAIKRFLSDQTSNKRLIRKLYKKGRVFRQNCGTVDYLALYRWRSWRAARFPWYTVAAPPAARYCGAGATAGTASPPSRPPAAPIGTSPSLCCALTHDSKCFFFLLLVFIVFNKPLIRNFVLHKSLYKHLHSKLNFVDKYCKQQYLHWSHNILKMLSKQLYPRQILFFWMYIGPQWMLCLTKHSLIVINPDLPWTQGTWVEVMVWDWRLDLAWGCCHWGGWGGTWSL